MLPGFLYQDYGAPPAGREDDHSFRQPVNIVGTYIELTKPRITWLILVSMALGFRFGSHGNWAWDTFLNVLAGTGLLASGAAALNQWYERSSDALMRRTAQRPIPSGRLGEKNALMFGLALSVAGLFDLMLCTNSLTALLGGITLLAYLLIYTPLKTRTKWAMAIGAIPGAMPPLIGYAAASGRIDGVGLSLFGILFLWQFPHFLAIACLYKEDYGRACIQVLPVAEPDGTSTVAQMRLTAVMLLPVSMTPFLLGATTPSYVLGGAILGTSFSYLVWRERVITHRAGSRRILLASVGYLPILYLFLWTART